jgi:hypothetical protein
MNLVTCFRVLSSQIGRASTESPLLLVLTTHILSKLVSDLLYLLLNQTHIEA